MSRPGIIENEVHGHRGTRAPADDRSGEPVVERKVNVSHFSYGQSFSREAGDAFSRRIVNERGNKLVDAHHRRRIVALLGIEVEQVNRIADAALSAIKR